MAKKPAKKVAKKLAPTRAKKAMKAAPKKAAKAVKAAPKKMAAKKAAPRKAAAPTPPEHARQTVIPNLVVKDAAKAIEFYKSALGATELMRMGAPDGKGVWHAELMISGSIFFINDESPMSPLKAPSAEHRATASINIYVPDIDATYKRATEHGATGTMPPADQFWGDRFGMIVDPFGCVCGMSTKVKELTMEEMKTAAEEAARQFAAQMQAQQGQNAGHAHHGEHAHVEHKQGEAAPGATQPPAQA